jgi:hypothetical protein
MKKYIVYILDKNTNSLAYFVDEIGDGLNHLINYEIISKNDKTLIIDGDIISLQNFYSIEFIDLVQFDNKKNPQKLIPIHIKAATFFLNTLREMRNLKLQELDFIQMRAFSLGKIDIFKLIEDDKQNLRDLINLNLYSNCKTILDYIRIEPAILHIDYKSKYSDLFDAKN